MSGFRDRAFYNPRHDTGFWSPATSLANFCEHDYAISFYIAECINTLSNVAYIYYALRPPKLSVPETSHEPQWNGSYTWQATSSSFRWDIHTFTLISIGVTSGIFHASLQRFPQFLDESSMYLLVAGFAFELLTTRYSIHREKLTVTHHHRQVAATAIVLTILTTSAISLYTSDLIIHSITFALSLIVCGLRMRRLIGQQGPEAKSRLHWHLIGAEVFLVAGFGLWLIDCSPSYCEVLGQARKHLVNMFPSPIGTALGFITELHGWWHILTARAAGAFISLIRYLTHNTPHNKVR